MGSRALISVSTYVLAANSLNNIVWWRTEKLGNDGELVHMVLAREERLSLQHLCKDAAGAPNINLDVVLLPGEHDLRGTVVPG